MKNILSAFREHKEFKKTVPWSAVPSVLAVDNNIVLPHYAETIEINIYHNAKGDIYIGGQHFELDGDHAVFIAPNTIHSMNYISGTATLLKINPVLLKPLIDLDILMEYNNKSFYELPIIISDFNLMHSIEETFKNGNINDVSIAILELFRYLLGLPNNASNQSVSNLYNIENNAELHSIITWTEENYINKITLNDISSHLGYSTHYFCKKFKKLTGISYITYLNHVRIQHSCKLMKNGHSISQVCEELNFDDISYFIQLFKKITGTTPKKYISLIK